MKFFIRSTGGPQVLESMSFGREGGRPRGDASVVVADLDQNQAAVLRSTPGVEIFADFDFSPPDEWHRREALKATTPGPASPPPWRTKTMEDVMVHINAPRAWEMQTGSGVTIAVVDTGTDLTTQQFPHRSSHSLAPSYSTALADPKGHGSMCAAIALGSRETGGRYAGVAPSAKLLTARTTFAASDLYAIYEDLLEKKKDRVIQGRLVVSNSYGLYTCSTPGVPQNHPYLDLVKLCIAEGMVFVFAAGNNHAHGLCQHSGAAAGPNTIWSVNSIDEVITVGTVDWNESNQLVGGEHSNSSRGPGEWSVTQSKPDVVAPTYGEVVWGGSYQHMEWWGTSGACPQVAGLAALVLAKKPNMSPADVKELIRAHARTLAAPATCVGAGIIDCEKTVTNA